MHEDDIQVTAVEPLSKGCAGLFVPCKEACCLLSQETKFWSLLCSEVIAFLDVDSEGLLWWKFKKMTLFLSSDSEDEAFW